jgi:hypothetical protein
MAIQKPAPTKSQEPSWYGGLDAVDVLGAQGWLGHNGEETWNDSGASERVVGQHADDLTAGIDQLVTSMRAALETDVRTTISGQVKDAVHEYARSAQFAVAIVGDELCVSVSMANDHAEVRPYVPMLDVILSACKQASSNPSFMVAVTKLATQVMAMTAQSNMMTGGRQPARRAAPAQQVATRQHTPATHELIPDNGAFGVVPVRRQST